MGSDKRIPNCMFATIVCLKPHTISLNHQHAERVLRILKLDDLIEGLVYCDYTERNFSCKPERAFYERVSGRAQFRLEIIHLFLETTGFKASERDRSIKVFLRRRQSTERRSRA
jgi:hypothetical protein